MNNYEKIKNMNIDEMAEFLYVILSTKECYNNCSKCPLQISEDELINRKKENEGGWYTERCYNEFEDRKKWLMREAYNETNKNNKN